MNATISTSPVSACWTTTVSSPAESNFGAKALPCSRSARSESVPEMALSFQSLAKVVGAGAGLLHDNHRCEAKSIARRKGAFVKKLSVK
jgi:hypothetical protein